MSAPKPSACPCDNCRLDLRVERNGHYVSMFICPTCGVTVIDPPKSPSAS